VTSEEEDVNIQPVLDAALVACGAATAPRAVIVGVSGIDGSGKSHLSALLARELTSCGLKSLLLGLDAWHRPPIVRFSKIDPGPHFYRNSHRLNELFELVVLPLKRTGSVRTQVELTRWPGGECYVETFDDDCVDVVIVEGIFLLRRELRAYYDLAVWIECSFETALRRAMARNQEGLSEAALIEEYTRVYFPAQEHHLLRDDPAASADLRIANDSFPGQV
jgi:uridine kinase